MLKFGSCTKIKHRALCVRSFRRSYYKGKERCFILKTVYIMKKKFTTVIWENPALQEAADALR